MRALYDQSQNFLTTSKMTMLKIIPKVNMQQALIKGN